MKKLTLSAALLLIAGSLSAGEFQMPSNKAMTFADASKTIKGADKKHRKMMKKRKKAEAKARRKAEKMRLKKEKIRKRKAAAKKKKDSGRNVERKVKVDHPKGTTYERKQPAVSGLPKTRVDLYDADGNPIPQSGTVGGKTWMR